MADNTVPIQGRNITLLQYPPRRPGQSDEFLDGFKWVQQYLYVDQIPEHSREFDTPYRIRLYDSKPAKNNLKQFQAYRTSLSVGEDLQISVFPSLEAMFTAMIEWRPAPKPSSDVMKQAGALALALSTRGRRWIFSVQETELLELLDLFRSIAPTTCASADKATREKDGLIDQLPVVMDEERSVSPFFSHNNDFNTTPRPRRQSVSMSSPGGPIVDCDEDSPDDVLTTSPSRIPRIMEQILDESFCTRVEPLDPNAPAIQIKIDPNDSKFSTSLPSTGPSSKINQNQFNTTLAPSKGNQLDKNKKKIQMDEVDNPTAGLLSNSMFIDHFSMDTPPIAPTTGQPRRPSVFALLDNTPTTPTSGGVVSPSTVHHTTGSAAAQKFTSTPITPSNSSQSESFSLDRPLVVTNTDNDDLVFESGVGGITVHTTSSSLIANNTIKSFQKVFNLPDDELIFSCSSSFLKSILLHGRIYISNKHLCFYSSIFGYRTKLVIPISDIQRAEPTTLAGVFGGGLKFTLASDAFTPLIFGSLRDQNKTRVVSTLERIGTHINPHLREQLAPILEPASNVRFSTTPSQTRTNQVDDDDDDVDKTDEEQDDDANGDDNSNAAPEEQCNLPVYDFFIYPAGPPSPSPFIFNAIHQEFATVLNTTVNCTFSQLWDGFLKNTAYKGFTDFYIERKEQNIRVSQWAPYTPDTDKANEVSNPFAGASEMLIRQVAFNAELKAPMGPPRVDIYKRQVCAIYKAPNGEINKLVLLAISATPDAPFGKEFFVCEQFTFLPSTTAPKAKLDVSLQMSAYFPKVPGWGLRMILGTLKSRVKSDGTGQHEDWLKWINVLVAAGPFQAEITGKYAPKPSFSLTGAVSKTKSIKKVKKVQKTQSVVSSFHEIAQSTQVMAQPVSTILPLPPFTIFGLPASMFVASVSALVIALSSFFNGFHGFDQGVKMSMLISLIVILSCLERGNQ